LFGENFTVEGLGDDRVCIGDRYRIGEAEFEVTQPRVTCFRVGIRTGEPRMAALMVAAHRPGFYLRVITEGQVQEGDEIRRTHRGRHALSVAAVDALLYLPDRDTALLRQALDVPALSPGWRRSFTELLAAAEAGPTAGPDAAHDAGWAGFRPLRVTRRVAETADVTSFHLQAPDSSRLPIPRPGQYLTLRLPGLGDPPPVRSYSLSDAGAADTYRISVKREPRGLVSAHLHTAMQVGSIIEAAAPRGEFVLSEAIGPVVLVSAGIGVTPVLAMLHHLAAVSWSGKVWWIHVTRDARSHAFAHEARALLASLPQARSVVFHTAADPQVVAPPGVVHGRPTRESLVRTGIPPDASAYLCGPASFMADLQELLVESGLAGTRIHTELFGARSAINPGVVATRALAPHQPSGAVGEGPPVTFARSGLTVAWDPRWATLLELAEAADVPTRWACRSGVCHTCLTPVLSGEFDYDPAPLEAPGPGQVLLCCARPSTALVIDL
jgi:ferredoxin-NADP reductase